MTARAARTTEAMTDINGITLWIPGTLDGRLSPNRNTPPRTLKRLRAKLRDHVHTTARAARNNLGYFGDAPLIDGPAYIDLRVRWETGRKFWDADNLIAACKAIPDALQAVGVIVNDRDLRWGDVVQERDPDGKGEIVVRIERIEE